MGDTPVDLWPAPPPRIVDRYFKLAILAAYDVKRIKSGGAGLDRRLLVTTTSLLLMRSSTKASRAIPLGLIEKTFIFGDREIIFKFERSSNEPTIHVKLMRACLNYPEGPPERLLETINAVRRRLADVGGKTLPCFRVSRTSAPPWKDPNKFGPYNKPKGYSTPKQLKKYKNKKLRILSAQELAELTGENRIVSPDKIDSEPTTNPLFDSAVKQLPGDLPQYQHHEEEEEEEEEDDSDLGLGAVAVHQSPPHYNPKAPQSPQPQFLNLSEVPPFPSRAPINNRRTSSPKTSNDDSNPPSVHLHLIMNKSKHKPFPTNTEYDDDLPAAPKTQHLYIRESLPEVDDVLSANDAFLEESTQPRTITVSSVPRERTAVIQPIQSVTEPAYKPNALPYSHTPPMQMSPRVSHNPQQSNLGPIQVVDNFPSEIESGKGTLFSHVPSNSAGPGGFRSQIVHSHSPPRRAGDQQTSFEKFPGKASPESLALSSMSGTKTSFSPPKLPETKQAIDEIAEMERGRGFEEGFVRGYQAAQASQADTSPHRLMSKKMKEQWQNAHPAGSETPSGSAEVDSLDDFENSTQIYRAAPFPAKEAMSSTTTVTAKPIQPSNPQRRLVSKLEREEQFFDSIRRGMEADARQSIHFAYQDAENMMSSSPPSPPKRRLPTQFGTPRSISPRNHSYHKKTKSDSKSRFWQSFVNEWNHQNGGPELHDSLA